MVWGRRTKNLIYVGTIEERKIQIERGSFWIGIQGKCRWPSNGKIFLWGELEKLTKGKIIIKAKKDFGAIEAIVCQ